MFYLFTLASFNLFPSTIPAEAISNFIILAILRQVFYKIHKIRINCHNRFF